MNDRLIQLDAQLDEAIIEFKEKEEKRYPISRALTSPVTAGGITAISGIPMVSASGLSKRAQLALLAGGGATGAGFQALQNKIYRRGEIGREKARRRKGRRAPEFKDAQI